MSWFPVMIQELLSKNAYKVFDNIHLHLSIPIDLIADLVMDLHRLSHEILNYYSTLGFNKLDWWIDASSQWKSLISSLFHVKNFLSPFYLMHFKRFALKTRRICQIKSPTELCNIDIAVLFITCEVVSCLRFVPLCEHPFSFRIPL